MHFLLTDEDYTLPMGDANPFTVTFGSESNSGSGIGSGIGSGVGSGIGFSSGSGIGFSSGSGIGSGVGSGVGSDVGSTSETAVISVVDDTAVESDHEFIVSILSTTPQTTIEISSMTVTIVDDDS